MYKISQLIINCCTRVRLKAICKHASQIAFTFEMQITVQN